MSPVEPTPELRVPKVSERAFISVPPFTVTGEIHLLPGADLREALEDLVGRFIPVTNATYWSDRVGEAPTPALVVAVNHNRAQILAPHRDSDPWADLDRSGAPASSPPSRNLRRPGATCPSQSCRRPAAPLQRRLGQRSTGKSSLLPHSAQPPS